VTNNPARAIDPGVLSAMHEHTLAELADLREGLESGRLQLLDKYTEPQFDAETGKLTGLYTYTFIVRPTPQ